jgi:ribosomal-protein-alanine N-acetyltransferase
MIDTVHNAVYYEGAEPFPPVTIAKMRIEDIEHVSRLERKCYSLPWSSSAYVTEVGNPSAYYTVAKDANGVVVGYAGMWVVMGEMHVTTIAVDPERRGQRIGERLLVDLVKFGMAHGANHATLEVREHNRVARNLYHKYGFVEVAVRRSYYSDNGENAIIMWITDLYDPEFQQLFRDHCRNNQM